MSDGAARSLSFSDGTLAKVRAELSRGSEPQRAIRSANSGLTAKRIWKVEEAVRTSMRGAGPLIQPLLDDPQVTDVLINTGQDIRVDRGEGLHAIAHTAHACPGDEVRALAVRLAASAGRRLDDASPIVDGTLPGGVRLHAVLPPLAADGPVISLRTQRRTAFTIEDLEARNTFAPAIAPVLRQLISARLNVFISGATGTGKTTILAALLALVPPEQRIICIEETAELRPDHPHVVRLQERRANIQSAGAIALPDLVKAALRMRPDRIILGECRGPETREVLSALNTGHEGGWATIHANSARDVPARLTALGALAGMDPPMVAAQAIAGIDAIMHLRRRAGHRWISEIGIFTPDGAHCHVLPALIIEPTAVPGPTWRIARGPGFSRLAQRIDLSHIPATAPAPVPATAPVPTPTDLPHREENV